MKARVMKDGGIVGGNLDAVLRISGKNLGALALAKACPRCLWLKLYLKHRLPYQIFPGIFSSIDSYSKRLVRDWFEEKAKSPSWLSELGPIHPCRKVPHFSEFQVLDERYNILLTGAPDEIFLLKGGTLIVDYKTARFTDVQDELLPMYWVQLNTYARIATACGFGPVKGLYLVYFEPLTDGDRSYADCCTEDGFHMKFSARPVKVELDLKMLEPLLAQARTLCDIPTPPSGRPDCEDCIRLEKLTAALAANGY
jgi:hypothetical protein